MNLVLRPTLALAAGVFSVAALAATAPLPVAPTRPSAAPLQVSHIRAGQPAIGGASTPLQPKVMGNNVYPGTPGPNAFRAYPPSCAADPLPTEASGYTWGATVPLYDVDQNNNVTTETVTVTVWRIACSSSGNATLYNPSGYLNAMTLMRIDRADDADTSRFPTMPIVQAAQGSIDFAQQASLVRVAAEPNTVVSEAAYGTLLTTSTTFVLENYPYVGSGYFTFSDAFTLQIDPQIRNVAPVDITIPAYSPTPAIYPDAYNPLPVDGYMGTAWYDPAHSGEGILAEVVDNYNSTTTAPTTRTFFAAWYTYDQLGLPFWITAQGTFPIGATSVTTTGYYQTGGGFAGSFGSSTTQHVWGTLTFSFPSCAEMDFSFNGQTDAQTNGPGGVGSRTWQRQADNNGMTCE